MPESPTLPVIIFSSYTNIKPYLNMSSGIYVLQMNWIKPLCIERFNFNHGFPHQILIGVIIENVLHVYVH